MKSKIALLSCLLIGSSLQAQIADYSSADKKAFDDLINVKRLSSAKKSQRIQDLRNLSALMINRLISTINGAGLGEEFKTDRLGDAIRSALSDPTVKLTSDLINAASYAEYGFDKEYKETLRHSKSLVPSKSDQQHAIIKALEKFNSTYSLVNTDLPREVTLGWIGSF